MQSWRVGSRVGGARCQRGAKQQVSKLSTRNPVLFASRRPKYKRRDPEAHSLRAPAVVAEHEGVAARVQELLHARRPGIEAAAAAKACEGRCSMQNGRSQDARTQLCIH